MYSSIQHGLFSNYNLFLKLLENKFCNLCKKRVHLALSLAVEFCGRKPTFLLGGSMSRQVAVARIEQLAAVVSQKTNVEIVEVELKGSGRNQLLRVFIDRPEGVTHSDCEQVSHSMSELLDEAGLFSAEYTLEVSSPGVERKLKKPEDYQRFKGQKARIVIHGAEIDRVGKSRFVEGTILGFENEEVLLEVAKGKNASDPDHLRIPFASIDRANLKFEW